MPRDNFASCLNMGMHGYTPTFIFDTSFGMGILDEPVSGIYRDGFDSELSARSISAGRRYLGHDGMTGAVSCGDTRIFGATVQFFEKGPPMTRKPAFSEPMALYSHSPEEMDCKITDDISKSNTILRILEPDAFISGYVPSPFLFAAALRGLEPLLMDIVSDEGYTHDILDFSEKASCIINEKICSTDACDSVLIPGAYDNVDLVGLDSLRDLCIPGLKALRKETDRYGLPCILHPHGVMTRGIGITALDMFLDAGYECIYYGEGNDHRMMSELAQGRCSIMGGIDTASTIYLGPDERASKDTDDVLDAVEDANFIFTCSCSVDAGLDRARLRLMMDAVRRRRHGGPGRI